jgi:hypothetical protein
VPSVRFSRDKRGYEYVYLVHTPTRRGKPGRTRVLYWYRTPPGVRIGRKPFDEEVRRTLEQQNPGVSFDWEAIIATPMPPPDMTEFWRERRRAEKAARQERRAGEAEETARTTAEAAPSSGASKERGAEGEASIGDARDLAPSAELSTDAAPRKRRRRRRRGGSGEPTAPGGLDPEDDSTADVTAEAASDAVDAPLSVEPSDAPDSASEAEGTDPSDDDPAGH